MDIRYSSSSSVKTLLSLYLQAKHCLTNFKNLMLLLLVHDRQGHELKFVERGCKNEF